ncbi:MAG: DUF2059 domain-containing protein [Brevundimonas sp.]|nr:DUF2059 domain-containing protein [Brevundimonas sp.]
MTKFLRGLLLALTIMAAPAVAQAQTAPSQQVDADTAERLALAHKFFVLIQGDQMAGSLRQMMDAIMPANPNMSAEHRVIVREVTGEMIETMMPRMFEAMAPVYADIFTLEELRVLVAFYESDVGQALLRKSAEATPRFTEAAMSVLPGVMMETADRLCDRLECTADQRRSVKASMAAQLPAEEAPIVVSY